MYASLCNVFFGYKHFQFLSKVSLHLSDSIAVPVHYWLYPIRLFLLILLLY